MSMIKVQSGSQIAAGNDQSSDHCAQTLIDLKTLGDLLLALESDSPKELPMLRSTASKIAEFYNHSPKEVTLEKVAELDGQFRRHLHGQKYTENSVRSYVNYVRILVKKARGFGWRPYQSLSTEWQRILALACRKKCTDTARFVALLGKAPNEVTKQDVDAWGENALARGVQRVNAKKGRFWKLLRDCGMTEYTPLSTIRAQSYTVPFDQLPLKLRAETDVLLKWKTADFQPRRPKGAQIREVTAEMIREKICHLFGFRTKIRALADVDSLSQLVTEDLVCDYISWCINERQVKGNTLRSHLGRLDVAMRQHPTYASLDLNWFKALLESLPVEPKSERKMRKAKKYLDYSVIEAIPSKIRAKRTTLRTHTGSEAELAMHEFLMKLLLVLAWRQRNIRECRIGGSSPNIFKAKVPNHIAIDMPAWVRSEEEKNPEAVFWQMHFAPKETKNGKAVDAFLPRQLVKPLEEYLTVFRPQLLKGGDPGTLFVTDDGKPMKDSDVYYAVTIITSRYGGRSVNPHLVRDIVAFAWLKAHPKDYLTLSKILWHSSIKETIETYGSRFDESSGVCAMEAWLEERGAAHVGKAVAPAL